MGSSPLELLYFKRGAQNLKPHASRKLVEHLPKPIFIDPGVDERAGDALVVQRFFDKKEVARTPVEIRCEGVTQAVK